MKREGIQFHEGVPEIGRLKEWFPKGGLLVLDDMMAEGGNDQEVLDLFAKHSHHENMTLIYLCQDMLIISWLSRTLDIKLGMTNLLLEAFPTNCQDIMEVYRKETER